MISESYIKDLLLSMGYIKKNHIYEKFFPSVDCYIKVDLKNRTIIYPEDRGMTISNRTTCNFSAPENFVVLECVTRLFDKGYRPEHLNLEKEWTLGHESKGGRADICVSNQEGNTLFIVECKTYGREYEKEYKNIVNDGGQLFSYWQQERSCKFLVLYASKYEGKQIKWDTESIDCSDDANIVALSKKDDSIKLFKNAHTVSELYSVWDETYEKRFSGDVIFRDDSSAYQIGVKPLRKADLKDFADNNKIVNKFEEILRHNNVSDKENAFNRLVALFICKLVDEIQKDMEEIVDFQYKVGTDTYESLQDRLQRLHKEGMEKFMKEEIFYVPDDYAENLVRQYTGQERKNMIAHLKHVLFRLTNAYDYFADIWERAIHAKGKQYIYEMSLEDHYLHSVCHLAEHFVRGGIGIRMVLDIYILSETPRMDKAYVQRQLKALKLQKFEENIRSLAQLWFSDDEKTVRTEVSDELENYALSGGIFGSRETARRNGTVLYESKNKFVKQLVFPSYEVMKTSCPWLKTPILLPAAWLVRYKRALTASRGNIGYHIERAKTFDRVEDQEQKERCQFFERCGLEDVSENF